MSAVFKTVPVDTIIIASLLLLTQAYILIVCRKDVAKWVMGVTSTLWTMYVKSRRRKTLVNKDRFRG